MYINRTYEDAIRTVQLFKRNNQLSFPIIRLGSEEQLTLSFDELGTKPSDFQVAFVNCDADWVPTNLMPIEYFDGFFTNRINTFVPAYNTLTPYIHYTYTFPTAPDGFKLSGNYLLIVYRDNQDQPTITRRFIVAEKQVKIVPDLGMTGHVSGRFKQQAVNFNLYPTGFPITDIGQEVRVMVLQNFRWDNAHHNLKPIYMYPDHFEYRFDAANDFMGGNEYRMFDIRNVRRPGYNVRQFHYTDSLTYVQLQPEKPRTFNQYLTEPDLNGAFFIDTRGNAGDLKQVDADYVEVEFLLKMDDPLATDVYVFGQLSDWALDPRYKMTYFDNAYRLRLLLKQGIYNYHYAVKDEETQKLDEVRLEGSHFETENQYTILVYYKAPIDRTHRLIGYEHINYYDQQR